MKHSIRRVLSALLTACVLLCAVPYARAARFADVPSGHWAAADIELCAQQGFMNGVTETEFGLGSPLSRAACLVILERVFHWPDGDLSALPYHDINPESWYVKALAAAYQQGVVTDQSSLFRPEDPVTRGELAATLVRALGYQTLSGLTEPVPFSDVSANVGYISLAYDMGLVNGNEGLFQPNAAATREQAAAILARLFRKLNATPVKSGVIGGSDGLWNRVTMESVAVKAGELTGLEDAPIRYRINPPDANAVRVKIVENGASALLYLSGDELLWNALRPIANAVRTGNYTGLLLELTGSSLDPEKIASLRDFLQNRPLYLIVPAPAQTADDYPYEALGRLSDGLSVRVTGQPRIVNDFATDPVEPLEEVYKAFRALFCPGADGSAPRLDASKCSLVMSASGAAWVGDERTGVLSGVEIDDLLHTDDMAAHYSERYACAYLRRLSSVEEASFVVWYLDARSVTTRVRLAKLFNVGGLLLMDADSATDDWLFAL